MDELKPGVTNVPKATPSEFPVTQEAKKYAVPQPSIVSDNLTYAESTPTSNDASGPVQDVNSEVWQYRAEAQTEFDDSAHSTDSIQLTEKISWSSLEFLAHDKSLLWYGVLAGSGIAGAFLIYILTKDTISTIVILFAALLFGLYAGHKPRLLQYTLSNRGLQIGTKLYGLQDFRSFAVTEESMSFSIVFMPLKRFMPPLTIYVTPDLENKVLSYLSQILPFEQHRQDAVDNLLKRIRF